MTIQESVRDLHATIDTRVDAKLPQAPSLEVKLGIVAGITPSLFMASVYLGGSKSATPYVSYGALPVTLVEGDSVVVLCRKDGWKEIVSVLKRNREESAGGGIGVPNSVIYRATGADDAAPLMALAAAAEEGTTFYLPDPEYLFQTANATGANVEIWKSNIRFVGRGRERLDTGNPSGGLSDTTIKCQVAGATMFRWRPVQVDPVAGPDQVDQVVGGGIFGVSLAGNANAATSLEVTGGCKGQQFETMWIGGATVQAVLASAGASHTGVHHTWHSTSEVVFRDCAIRGSGSVDGAVLNGNANANGGENSFEWVFENSTFTVTDGTGLQINDSDDIFIRTCGFNVAGTGKPWDITGSSGKPHGRAVMFTSCYGADFSAGVVRATGLTKAARSILINGMSTEDATGLMAPTIEPGAGLHYVDDWGRHTYRPDLRTSSCLTDDFNGGLLTDGNIGETGWHLIGAGATVAYVAATSSRIGVRTLGTGAGVALCGFVQSGATNTGLSPAMGFESSFLFRLDHAGSDADVMCRVGFGNSYAADPPADGFWLEKMLADTTWWFVTSNGSTKTRVDSGTTVVSGGWVRFRARRRNDTQLGLSITDIVDGVDNAIISTNLPTVALSAFFHVRSGSVAVKTIGVDAFQLQSIGIFR